MPVGDFNPAPKPGKQARGSKTAKERGAISAAVYQEAAARAGGCCERCGWDWLKNLGRPGIRFGLEAAHYKRRHNFGQEGVQAYDILMLCGPQVNTGTCHHWIDSTREGMQWAIHKREEIRQAAARQINTNQSEIILQDDGDQINIMEV